MIPMMYDESNLIDSKSNPSAITVTNTRLSAFFRRYLLQKAMAVFKWDLPEWWSKRYFLYTLFLYGHLAVFETDKFGVIPQQCGLTGYNVFYQPTGAVIANPLIYAPKPLTIDRECVLFTMTEDYGGIADLVNYYGDMMALVAESAGVNTINSRLAYLFFAKNKTFAESFKKTADAVISGQPFVVVDSSLKTAPDGSINMAQFEQNLSQNFIAPELMQLLRDIENQFATEVGIRNANTEKKERLISDEVNANNDETILRASSWLENWQTSCKKVKDMFGVDVGVKWRIEPQSETPKEVPADA